MKQNRTIKELTGIRQSYNAEARLVQILQSSYVKDEYLDSFVYGIARELNVSVDYLYGWIEDPCMFIPCSKNSNDKQRTISEIITKYNVKNEGINELAFSTNIDSSVLQYLMNKNPRFSWSSCITTSYYTIKRLCKTFNLNFDMIMRFLVDSDENSDVDSIIDWYEEDDPLRNDKYNSNLI